MEEIVTIIVPFVALNDYVLETIEGISGLLYHHFELILLPDNPVTLPAPLHKNFIRIIPTGDVTIAKKRNIGIVQGKGKYFAFIDSDAYPDPNWLSHALREFSSHPENLWVVGGPNITPPKEGILQRCVGNASQSYLVAGFRSYRKKIARSRFVLDLPSCNLIVKKDAMDKLTGFNEKLITGEDIELCNRIIKHNGNIFYSSGVIVYHHNRTLFKPYFQQRITYGLSVFKVLREHLSISNLFLLFPFLFLLFPLFFPFAALLIPTLSLFWIAIVMLYLLLILIESIKYSNKVLEFPYTFLAILTGNLFPGIGTLLALCRIPVNIKAIYRNHYHLKR